MARKKGERRKMLLKKICLITGIIIVILGLILFKPISTANLTAHGNPATTYEQGINTLKLFQTQDTAHIYQPCRTQLLTHGKKTPKVIILLHGYTNCPEQFKKLGTAFYSIGYNVVIPRLPYHGYINRNWHDLEKLRAEDLTQTLDTVIDGTSGLADQVIVAGLSGGGIMAGWTGQERSLTKAVLIAPSFLSEQVSVPALNALRTLPNFFRWWDPVGQDTTPGFDHVYPGYSTHALGEIWRLGHALIQFSHHKPQTNSLLIITNASDHQVDNFVTQSLIDNWRRSGATVETYTFPENWHLNHDIIDPHSPEQQIDKVYPQLLKLIDKQ